MVSLRASVLRNVIQAVVRRRNWGKGTKLVRRARRLFGIMRSLQFGRRLDADRLPLAIAHIQGDDFNQAENTGVILLYLHGGGYLGCSPATHRPITAALAKLIPARVIVPDYRLAPENPFPSALDDAVATYRWILEQAGTAEHIYLAGDSAGGGLSLALMYKLKELKLPLPNKVALFSPWTDLTGSGESVKNNDGKCAMFRGENLDGFASHYAPKEIRDDPFISPLFGDLADLPPMLIQVDSSEVLFDDSRRLHYNAIAAGVQSELQVSQGLFHVWQIYYGLIPEAHTSLQAVARFLIQPHFETCQSS
jgi:epsilon-lactone hydrolase